MKQAHRWARGFARWFLILLFIGSGAAQADRKADWMVIELGNLGTLKGGIVGGVNNRGDVVGSDALPGPSGCCQTHPFTWRNGTFTDLRPAGTTNGSAIAVNERGTVLLQMDGTQIFVAREGQATKLPFLGVARGMNGRDDVVGSAQVGFAGHAFVFREGVLHDLGTLGGTSSEAFAVNNHGMVVGRARLANNSQDHAFALVDGRLRDIDAFNSRSSSAFSVNDAGVVVGAFSDFAFQTFAFIWDARQGMRKLIDEQGAIAVSINNRGDVVGTIGGSGAFLLSDGMLTRLETLPAVQAAGFTRVVPRQINDRGWIVGTASSNTKVSKVLLVPRS